MEVGRVVNTSMSGELAKLQSFGVGICRGIVP